MTRAGAKPEEPGALKVFYYEGSKLTNEASVAPNGGYGFGPRHLDFHPTKPWVYVSLERQNRLDMLTRSTMGARCRARRCTRRARWASPAIFAAGRPSVP